MPLHHKIPRALSSGFVVIGDGRTLHCAPMCQDRPVDLKNLCQRNHPNRLPPRPTRFRLLAIDSPSASRWCSVLLSGWMLAASVAYSADSTEESIALYADAANFQTSGAFDLAITNWNQFLKMYPDDELASKAAHYLGVCYMQRKNPDYVGAAKAFAVALEDEDYDLREESLANQGWCYYASAGDGPQRDQERLKKTIETFELLREENPKSDYIDRAYFYSGEAAYGLGDRKKAIRLYDAFLKLPGAADSPLRCDALYAKGIAHEELKQVDQALGIYQNLLRSCSGDDLVVDVHMRLGDLQIVRSQFAEAVKSFDAALKEAKDDDDKSYALFRQAYALVQSGSPGEAAVRYDTLQKDYPNSPYAAGATLAAGQSLYRDGKIDDAAARFEKVLGQNNLQAATEAAHWLVRISLSKGNSADAAAIAKKQLDAGTEGEFAVDLQVDLAEALAMNPQTLAESARLAEQAYRSAPTDALAPRALYNAAFSLLQLNQYDKAAKLSTEFLSKFASDQLASDVRFIAAESQLLSGKTKDAVASYRQLLANAAADDVQRPVWVLRAGLAMNTLRAFDDAIELLKQEYANINQPGQKAEAQFLVGQAHMMSGRPADAAVSFGRATSLSPDWPRSGEATLLRGTALLQAGKDAEAKKAWDELLKADPKSRMADQARYKLAQTASSNGDFVTAVSLYDQIIDGKRDQGLIPYALYGRGWSQMQEGKHKQAIVSLDRLLKDSPGHPLSDDALIARGISHRTNGSFDQARADLESYLKLKPTGVNLGHALYELALVDQKQGKSNAAIDKLSRLTKEVPDYSGMEKVLYELGWTLRESGKEAEAADQFRALLEAISPDESCSRRGILCRTAELHQGRLESSGQVLSNRRRSGR